MAKSAKAAKNSANAKILVPYSGALLRSLESQLRSAFNLPNYIKLSGLPGPHVTKFDVDFAATPMTAHLDGGSEQKVVEIALNNKSSGFYLGFQATFKSDAIVKYFLHSASVSVFHKIAGELIPLFRAEWHELDASSDTSQHAQPHWHFVQHPGRIERIIQKAQAASTGKTLEFMPEQKSELFSKLADCGKFHFAMTSLWSRQDTHKVFDSDGFMKWFKGLTEHIAGQLRHVVKKMPTAGVDFIPNAGTETGKTP